MLKPVLLSVISVLLFPALSKASPQSGGHIELFDPARAAVDSDPESPLPPALLPRSNSFSFAWQQTLEQPSDHERFKRLFLYPGIEVDHTTWWHLRSDVKAALYNVHPSVARATINEPTSGCPLVVSITVVHVPGRTPTREITTRLQERAINAIRPLMADSAALDVDGPRAGDFVIEYVSADDIASGSLQ